MKNNEQLKKHIDETHDRIVSIFCSEPIKEKKKNSIDESLSLNSSHLPSRDLYNLNFNDENKQDEKYNNLNDMIIIHNNSIKILTQEIESTERNHINYLKDINLQKSKFKNLFRKILITILILIVLSFYLKRN